MGATAATIAVIAAAHAQRVQEVTDAFRLAGATAPDRAQSLEALGVQHVAEAEQLAQSGVLVSGPRGGTWYLSEAALVAQREAAAQTPRWLLVVIVVLVAIGAVAIGLLVARRSS